MVALVVSIILTAIMCGAVLWYAKRRPVGAMLTWGEAMLAAAYVFAIFFMVYGVVPHLWLTYADNELAWRPDKFVHGPGEILKPAAEGGPFMPFTISYQTIRDLIAVGIYAIALGGNIAFWVIWQNRGKAAEAPEPTSEYGRPLVREAPKSETVGA